MDEPGPTLVFDGDCGFCTSSALWAAEHLQPTGDRRVQVTAWQHADLDRLGVSAERTQREVVWVAHDGQILGGAEAAAALLRFRGGGWGVIGRLMQLPVVRLIAAAVYRLIAKNRYRMPGGTPACALPPRD